MYIFVKVCLGSSCSIAVPDCNDTSSLEACNCIIRANSPVFTTFYFQFRHWAFWTKLIATTRLKIFQYHLVWTCIHKKLIACHSPNFKICVWVKNNLTCDLAAAHENWRQETFKLTSGCKSNCFPLTSAEVNLKVYCPWSRTAKKSQTRVLCSYPFNVYCMIFEHNNLKIISLSEWIVIFDYGTSWKSLYCVLAHWRFLKLTHASFFYHFVCPLSEW